MNVSKYQLSSVQALYGNKPGVTVDELTFAAGRLHVLAGPNGSGKSTLLSIMAFLIRPDKGEVFFDGMPVKWESKTCATLRKRVTLLQQHPYLFSGSVAVNVAFGPLARGASKRCAQDLTKEALEMVGLEGFELRNARQLSGGESRRVALARALACKSEVLLLDEPLAHVDQASAEVLESLIVSLSDGGLTVVMSSHDEQLGGRLGGRVIYLKDGKVDRTSEQHPKVGSLRSTGGDGRANP